MGNSVGDGATLELVVELVAFRAVNEWLADVLADAEFKLLEELVDSNRSNNRRSSFHRRDVGAAAS